MPYYNMALAWVFSGIYGLKPLNFRHCHKKKVLISVVIDFGKGFVVGFFGLG
jgi:hypothetical protein